MKRLTLLILGFTIAMVGQAQFKVGAEYRIRSEYKDGLKTLSDDSKTAAFTTSQRTRLNVDFSNEKLKAFIAVQDVRVWGEIPHKTDVAAIALDQAYVRYSMNDKFAFKLGRQKLIYDNKYVLGVKNWNNVSVSHDVALLQFKSDNTQAHGGFAYNNEKDVLFETDYTLNYYKYLGMLWFKHAFNDNFNVSLLNYYEGRQKENAYDTIYTRGTIGPFVNMKAGIFKFTLASYYQFGKSKTGKDVSAYFIHFEPSITPVDPLKISVGIDYFSGDDAIDDNGKANTFSNPYGDGHGYYGLMDYFTNIEKNTKNGGLNDIFLKVSFKATDKMSLNAAFHNFQLTNNVIDSISDPLVIKAADKQLGNEIDLFMKYNFFEKSTLQIGYSTMFATKSMEIIKGGDSNKMQNWLYISIQFKPTFFNSETK